VGPERVLGLPEIPVSALRKDDMDDVLYRIDPQPQPGCLVLHLSGELDLLAREPLLTEFERHTGPNAVVVDVSEAQFIDASVIGAIFHGAGLARERGSRFVLVDAQSPPRSIWHHTRFADVCPVYHSVQEASAALGV
jgi:anti-anti-sigma factor